MVRVEWDGKAVGHILYPPYVLDLGKVEKGSHMLDLVLLNTRENAFGPLHRTDYSNKWIGPDSWRTADSYWTESYRLTKAGVLSAPLLEEYTKE